MLAFQSFSAGIVFGVGVLFEVSVDFVGGRIDHDCIRTVESQGLQNVECAQRVGLEVPIIAGSCFCVN